MSQAVDHKKFCYDYSELRINGKTPEQYFEEKNSRFRPSSFGLELEVGSTYFVGVVLPKMVGSGYFPFQICARYNCMEPVLVERFADESRGGRVTLGPGGKLVFGELLEKYDYRVIESEVFSTFHHIIFISRHTLQSFLFLIVQ